MRLFVVPNAIGITLIFLAIAASDARAQDQPVQQPITADSSPPATSPGAPASPGRSDEPPEEETFGTWHWQLNTGFRIFQPKLRVYFDTGTDEDDEIDVFDDGSLAATVNLVELRWNHSWYHWGMKRDEGGNLSYIVLNDEGDLAEPGTTPTMDNVKKEYSKWSIGLALGGGIGAPANDSEDGTEEASSAPVLLLSAGPYLEYDLGNWLGDEFPKLKNTGKRFGLPAVLRTRFLLEGGWTIGVSTDENLGDSTDQALYFGLGIHIPFVN